MLLRQCTNLFRRARPHKHERLHGWPSVIGRSAQPLKVSKPAFEHRPSLGLEQLSWVDLRKGRLINGHCEPTLDVVFDEEVRLTVFMAKRTPHHMFVIQRIQRSFDVNVPAGDFDPLWDEGRHALQIDLFQVPDQIPVLAYP